MGKTCTNDGKFTVSNRGCHLSKGGRIRKIKLCKYLGKNIPGRGECVIDCKTTFIQVFS